MSGWGRRLRRCAAIGVGVVVTGGTAESSWGISPSDVSADGRFVAFVKDGDGVVEGDANGALDLFVRDRATGATEGVGFNEAGELVGANGGTISDDGRLVAFVASDGILAEDTNGLPDAFLRDRETGTTVLLTRGADGGQSNGLTGVPQISGDGRFVAYQSAASNLVEGDANGSTDVFLYDVQAAARGGRATLPRSRPTAASSPLPRPPGTSIRRRTPSAARCSSGIAPPRR